MLSANGPVGRVSGGGLRLVPGAKGGRLVRDNAVDACVGEAGPVRGRIGRPGPELQTMVTGGIRGVRPNDRVKEGDGTDAVLIRPGAERLQPGAAHGGDDEGRVDLRREGPGTLDEVVVEGVEGSPGLGAMASNDVEGGVEENGALLGVFGATFSSHMTSMRPSTRSSTSPSDGTRSPSPASAEARSARGMSATGPERFVVRSRVWSWRRTGTPSAQRWRSISMAAALAREARTPARVLAGASPAAAAWAMTMGAPMAPARITRAMRDCVMPQGCLFCAIVAGEEPASVVWEDPLAMAFMDLRQPNPGHVLVVPREHIADILELDDHTGAALIAGTTRVARGVARAFAPDGLNVWQSTGEAAGQEVFHLHLHVMPRRTGDTLFRPYTELPPPTPRDTLNELAEELRGHLTEEA